jgi:hypothetical protein
MPPRPPRRRHLLAAPAPSIVVKSITADAIEMEISFFVEELAQSARAQNELFDWISRHLAAAGIGLASTQSQPYWLAQVANPRSTKTAAERATDLVAIFADLTEDERKALASKARQKQEPRSDVPAGTGLHAPKRTPQKISLSEHLPHRVKGNLG